MYLLDVVPGGVRDDVQRALLVQHTHTSWTVHTHHGLYHMVCHARRLPISLVETSNNLVEPSNLKGAANIKSCI